MNATNTRKFKHRIAFGDGTTYVEVMEDDSAYRCVRDVNNPPEFRSTRMPTYFGTSVGITLDFAQRAVDSGAWEEID